MLNLVSVSLAVAASVLGADSLQFTNVHATYGVRGPARSDNKVLAGDQFILTFDIEGITVGEQGQVQYSMATEGADASGKVVFKNEPHDLKVVVALGGHQLPAYAQFKFGLDQPPGDYQVQVTVADKQSNQTQSIKQTVTVLPPDFGIVHLVTASDEEGRDTTCVFGTGEAMHLHFMMVGFGRDASTSQPNVAMEVRILDENGQPTLQNPFAAEINEAVPASRHVSAHFVLSLNRPGKFNVTVKATDRVSNKTAETTFPLQVWPSR